MRIFSFSSVQHSTAFKNQHRFNVQLSASPSHISWVMLPPDVSKDKLYVALLSRLCVAHLPRLKLYVMSLWLQPALICNQQYYESLCLQKTYSYTHDSMKNSVQPKKSVLFYPQLVIWLNDYKNLVTFVTVWLKFSWDADFDSIGRFSGVGHTLLVGWITGATCQQQWKNNDNDTNHDNDKQAPAPSLMSHCSWGGSWVLPANDKEWDTKQQTGDDNDTNRDNINS